MCKYHYDHARYLKKKCSAGNFVTDNGGAIGSLKITADFADQFVSRSPIRLSALEVAGNVGM
jgi:hypothetical protein